MLYFAIGRSIAGSYAVCVCVCARVNAQPDSVKANELQLHTFGRITVKKPREKLCTCIWLQRRNEKKTPKGNWDTQRYRNAPDTLANRMEMYVRSKTNEEQQQSKRCNCNGETESSGSSWQWRVAFVFAPPQKLPQYIVQYTSVVVHTQRVYVLHQRQSELWDAWRV